MSEKQAEHPIFARIRQRVEALHFEESGVVDGVEYTCRTTDGADEDWILTQSRSGGDGAGFFVGQVKPRIARTLVAINPKPGDPSTKESVEALWPIPNNALERQIITMSNEVTRTWRAEQILKWLNSQDCDPSIVAGIQFEVLSKLDAKKSKLVGERRNLSSGTPSNA